MPNTMNDTNSVTQYATLEEARPLLEELRMQYFKVPCDITICKTLLNSLKLIIPRLRSSPPLPIRQDTEELRVAVEALELGVFVSVRSKDVGAFERYFSQLSIFYQDFCSILQQSTQQNVIIGMYLLHLLSVNRIGDFHMALELISIKDRSDKHIKYVIELEQNLMTGSYKEISSARQNLPNPLFSLFINSLISTVRLKVASCLEKSYGCVNVEYAAALLLFDIPADLHLFAHSQNRRRLVEGEDVDTEWNIKDENLVFTKFPSQKPKIAALELIDNAIGYATELERIV
ncbi:SAC3/GANP family protein [Cardiosporidium cionae]|uniref:SAC3/GANP family protein n=1 Tax=Cardiosporidium cionae TaxID=476202 RepID=A0ABQ7J6Z0_9APIC|nr:SAC3/GANP family protein [Cardiosporidium cionae]|eukprot:KAF8819723.1 SAC3/GANP family protein [Cardiosporidium cionae]